MAKSVQWLDSLAFDCFPFVFLIFNAALVDVSEPLQAIVSAIHVDAAVPKDHGVIRPLARPISRLAIPNIDPFHLEQVVVKQVLIKISALFLVSAKEEEFVVIIDSFGTGPRQGNLAFAREQEPPIDEDVVFIQVVLAVIIVRATE